MRGHPVRSVLLLAVALVLGMVPAVPAYAVSCPTVGDDGVVTPAPSGPTTDWSGCDLTLGGSRTVQLAYADLAGANLTGVGLYGANLYSADLHGATLAGADMRWAFFDGSNLTDADLTGANLESARLGPYPGSIAATVTGADFTGASLKYARLNTLDFAGAVLDQVSLIGAELSDADLRQAVLGTARVGGAVLTRTNLSGTDLRGWEFWTSGVAALPTLQNVDLTDANLHGVSLAGADLTYAKLNGADLGAADLTGALFDSTKAIGVDLTDATLRTATLKYSDFTDADLSGADLSSARFDYPTFTRATLTGATLTGATTGFVTGVPTALPSSNWRLYAGYLFGPGAVIPYGEFAGLDASGLDLTGIQLESANLTGASFAGANLTGASLRRDTLVDVDLDGADLTDAHLDGASLTGATGAGATWTRTTCASGALASRHIGGTCLSAYDGTAPVVSMTAPVSATSPALRLAARWTATDAGAGVASSDLRWMRTKVVGGVPGAWATPAAWSSLSSPTAELTGAAGYRYCFSARARDKVGNLGDWSAARCTSTPVDDASLRAGRGWIRKKASGWFAGTASQTTRSGAVLRTTGSVSTQQVGVIATTCRTCGKVMVYVGGTVVGTVSLRRATTTPHQLLLLPRQGRVRSGVVSLIVVSSRKSVRIDGVVVA